MSVERRGTVNYPLFTDHALMMSIQALERTTISSYSRSNTIVSGGVRAATILGRDSSTDVIDVARLAQRGRAVLQYVEVAESKGRLCCLDSYIDAAIWLKIITLANDCQSCNVMLMSTENGVVLKTIKCISPGEPLLMWFNHTILAMMDIPFLSPSNIQGEGRYICHICNNLYEFPNPLKIHLVLKCNRLDTNHLWTTLAKGFASLPRTTLSLNIFHQSMESFHFELPPGSPSRSSPSRGSPLIKALDSSSSAKNKSTKTSPTSSTQVSPISSTQVSPTTSNQVSPTSSNQVSPTTSNKTSPTTSNTTSPTSSNQTSPTSSNQTSPTTSGPALPTLLDTALTTSSNGPIIPNSSSQSTSSNSLVQVSSSSPNQVPLQIRTNIVHRGSSAFKPYMNTPSVSNGNYNVVPHCNESMPSHSTYHHVAPGPPLPLRSDDHAQMETIVSNLGKSREGHQCIYCGKIYSRKYGLKIHLRTHTGYKPLKCKFCSRPFGDPSNLNKHMRLHADGETPYRCELCGKVLVRRRDLERHMRSRHQDNTTHVSDSSSEENDD